MPKILIATTNKGKLEEMLAEFKDLNFEFLSLKDLKLDKINLDEPYDTLEQNALHKARFFAKKSKLLTIAEDSGLFVNYLKGAPGVFSRRYGRNDKERVDKILENLKGIPDGKRGASFRGSACIYDPKKNNYTIFNNKVNGIITKKFITKSRNGMPYNSIFYYPPLKKTFAELGILEKNEISHRGKIINEIKYHLTKQFNFKQIIASGGILIRDRKLLMTKRRDQRPEFNNKWEFPGGCVDKGETIVETLKREVKEETGFIVEPIEIIPEILTKTEGKYNYQVFLVFYICKIVSGKFKTAEAEIAGHGWFTYAEALKNNLLPLNDVYLKNHKKLLKKYID